MAQTVERKREYMRGYNAEHKEQQQAYYDQDYRKEHREAIKVAKGKINLRNKEFLAQQKAGKVCTMCHREADPRKLLFHHVDPATKLFTVGAHTGRSIQALIAEIAKCVIWCKPCHTKHHNALKPRANGKFTG
jgi:hypothetical protein